jgi:hypothetical protein
VSSVTFGYDVSRIIGAYDEGAEKVLKQIAFGHVVLPSGKMRGFLFAVGIMIRARAASPLGNDIRHTDGFQ